MGSETAVNQIRIFPHNTSCVLSWKSGPQVALEGFSQCIPLSPGSWHPHLISSNPCSQSHEPPHTLTSVYNWLPQWGWEFQWIPFPSLSPNLLVTCGGHPPAKATQFLYLTQLLQTWALCRASGSLLSSSFVSSLLLTSSLPLILTSSHSCFYQSAWSCTQLVTMYHDSYAPCTGLAAMQSPRLKHTPYFLGWRDTFEDFLAKFEDLTYRCRLTDQQQVDALICYVNSSFHKYCRTLSGYHLRNWTWFWHSLVNAFSIIP